MKAAEFRAALGALGWTRVQLGAVLGCSESLVRRWASGEQPVPAPVGRWLRAVVRTLRAHPPPRWRVHRGYGSVSGCEAGGRDDEGSELAEHNNANCGPDGVGVEGDSIESLQRPCDPP